MLTKDRWLSESIEAEVMHHGDSLEELIEEELIDLGLDAVEVQRLDVPELVDVGKGDVGHANLLALINVGRALHHMQHRGEHLGRSHPEALGIAVF